MQLGPKHLLVCGVKVPVAYVPDLTDEDHQLVSGLTSVEEYGIKISTTLNKTPLQVARTLFHEYLHAIMEISGLDCVVKPEVEEALVRCFEFQLYPLVDKTRFLG